LAEDIVNTSVLCTSISLRGQLNPLLTLAGELNRRDRCDVWVATDDERQTDVEGLSTDPDRPVRFAPLGPQIRRLAPDLWTDEEYAATAGSSRWKSYLTFFNRTFDIDSYTEKYHRLNEVVDRVRPDLMVVDAGTMYGFEVAMTRGIPFVISVPFPVSSLLLDRLPWSYPAPFSGLPLRMNRRQRLENFAFRLRLATIGLRPAVMSQGMRYFKTRTELGIANPKCNIPARVDAARAILSYSVFGLEYPFPDPPAHLAMVGAMVPPRPPVAADCEIQRWLDERASVVYAGFGTLMRLDQRQVTGLVEVARQLGPEHHVLWKLPKDQQDLLPPAETLPANLRIEHWLPSQTDVLAHPNVRAYFTHGGGNSMAEGFYFGTPMLVMPFWLDCYDLAVRAADTGAALAVDRDALADPARVTGHLRRLVSEDRFRERAEHWSSRQREAGGLDAAARIVLEHLDRVS
jgi:polyene glycosyltransferase